MIIILIIAKVHAVLEVLYFQNCVTVSWTGEGRMLKKTLPNFFGGLGHRAITSIGFA